MAALEQTAPAFSRQPRLLRARWIAIAAALVVVLGAGTVAYLLHSEQSRSHLRFPDPYRHGAVVLSLPHERVGQTAFIDAEVDSSVSPYAHHFINFNKLAPRISTNTADATVALDVCVLNPDQEAIGETFSSRPWCLSARRFDSGRLDIDGDVNQLVYVVTPGRPGVVRIAGCNASYSVGSQHSTQHVGDDFRGGAQAKR